MSSQNLQALQQTHPAGFLVRLHRHQNCIKSHLNISKRLSFLATDLKNAEGKASRMVKSMVKLEIKIMKYKF